MRRRASSIDGLDFRGASKSSARAAASASIAITARVLRTTRCSLIADVIPMLTKSSLLPLVVMDPVDAG